MTVSSGTARAARNRGDTCEDYGTVAGCGECTIDITRASSIEPLHPIAICLILSEIIWHGRSGNIRLADYTVLCNGVIKPKRSRNSGIRIKHSNVLCEWVGRARAQETYSEELISALEAHAISTELVTDPSELTSRYNRLILSIRSMCHAT
jgi:hypothetical protein